MNHQAPRPLQAEFKLIKAHFSPNQDNQSKDWNALGRMIGQEVSDMTEPPERLPGWPQPPRNGAVGALEECFFLLIRSGLAKRGMKLSDDHEGYAQAFFLWRVMSDASSYPANWQALVNAFGLTRTTLKTLTKKRERQLIDLFHLAHKALTELGTGPSTITHQEFLAGIHASWERQQQDTTTYRPY